MKAAIYPGGGKPIVIESLPDPAPGKDDVLIKVRRCGICGTDLSMTRGQLFDYGAGSQFGHEYAGEIVAVGQNVTSFSVGDKIGVLPSLACGACAACAHGTNVLCRNVSGTAMVGFAEYARIHASLAVRLPGTLSFADGALIEPLAVSLYGIRQSAMQAGETVLVLGGGTVALYTIYWARRLGARRVVAISRSSRRKSLALAMGADAFVEMGENNAGDVAEALGAPCDLVYECVGSPGLLSKAITFVRPFGKIVSLGFCTAPDPIIPALGAMKCATLQFLVGYGMGEFLYIADQMDKGHVDPKAIITRQIALADLPAMFDTLRAPNAETKVHVAF